MGKWNVAYEKLPEPNVLVWCKRNSGVIYISKRSNEPYSENKDASKNCHWYGERYSVEQNILSGSGSSYSFSCNFSDVTVDKWCYLVEPYGCTKDEE